MIRSRSRCTHARCARAQRASASASAARSPSSSAHDRRAPANESSVAPNSPLLLLLAGAEKLLRKIDYPEIEPAIYELRGIVSRKKQLLPYLTHLLQQVG